MSELEHRPGVQEINLVYRYLKLEGVNSDNRGLIIEKINAVTGIESVEFDSEKSILTLSYDASHCSLEDFEQLLHECDVDTDNGLWTKIKEGYYKFIDQNVKDNAEHDPHCCNSLPKTLPGSRKH